MQSTEAVLLLDLKPTTTPPKITQSQKTGVHVCNERNSGSRNHLELGYITGLNRWRVGVAISQGSFRWSPRKWCGMVALWTPGSLLGWWRSRWGPYKLLERVLAVKNNTESVMSFFRLCNYAFNLIMKALKKRRYINDKLNCCFEAQRQF